MLSVLLRAQQYEIRTQNKENGFVAVEMRIVSGTSPVTTDFITDLTFGLKWLSSYNVDLVNTITTSYNIIKSDMRKKKGIYYFQAFSAANTPFVFPATWTLNNWVEIMSVRNSLTGTGFGTFELAETGFDPTTDLNFGVSLVDFNPAINGSATNVALPVNLTSFEAVAKKTFIRLKWTMQEEQNNRGFEITRSVQENGGFTKIGWLNSIGNSGGIYEWLDKDAKAGIQYYYQLKQIDKDGFSRYSAIKTARRQAPNNMAIHIMPKPADKMISVVFDGTFTTGKTLIKIIDTKGAIVQRKNYDISTGRKADIGISSLASGQYFLIVENNNSVLFAESFLKN